MVFSIKISELLSIFLSIIVPKANVKQKGKNERENTKYYSSKILGKALRIAGVIHLCEHTASECISGETMQAAIEIATYFGQHYLKMMCADNYDNSVQYLLEKITARIMRDGRTVISLRDIKRTAKRLSSEQIETALEKLTAFNYLKGTSKNLPHGKFSMTLCIFRVSET